MWECECGCACVRLCLESACGSVCEVRDVNVHMCVCVIVDVNV